MIVGLADTFGELIIGIRVRAGGGRYRKRDWFLGRIGCRDAVARVEGVACDADAVGNCFAVYGIGRADSAGALNIVVSSNTDTGIGTEIEEFIFFARRATDSELWVVVVRCSAVRTHTLNEVEPW